MLITSWEQLLSTIRIDESGITANELSQMSQWINANVSTDVTFSADQATCFAEMEAYLRRFFSATALFNPEQPSQTHAELKKLTVVQYASFQGYDSWLKNTLESAPNRKALINHANIGGNASLHLAALAGHAVTVKVLVQLGASWTTANKLKSNPLHLSLTFLPGADGDSLRKSKQAIFDFLRPHLQAQIADVDGSGNNITHLAAENGLVSVINYCQEHFPELAKQANHQHCTALLTALLNKQWAVAKILTGDKGLLSITGQHERLPVHYAALYATSELVAVCLPDDSTVDATDEYRQTPLHLAAAAGKLDCVQYLVGKGASVTAHDVNGKTVLSHAIAARHLPLICWLVENTAVDLDHQDKMGQTPLRSALDNIQTADKTARTIVQYLIDKGSDLSIEDNNQMSAREIIEQLGLDVSLTQQNIFA